MVVEENTLSKYALSALNTAVNEPNDDAEYIGYIQKYVLYFENASKKSKQIYVTLCMI